jgi:hypothetical protein
MNSEPFSTSNHGHVSRPTYYGLGNMCDCDEDLRPYVSVTYVGEAQEEVSQREVASSSRDKERFSQTEAEVERCFQAEKMKNPRENRSCPSPVTPRGIGLSERPSEADIPPPSEHEIKKLADKVSDFLMQAENFNTYEATIYVNGEGFPRDRNILRATVDKLRADFEHDDAFLTRVGVFSQQVNHFIKINNL